MPQKTFEEYVELQIKLLDQAYINFLKEEGMVSILDNLYYSTDSKNKIVSFGYFDKERFPQRMREEILNTRQSINNRFR
jgi:hypothetical protein